MIKSDRILLANLLIKIDTQGKQVFVCNQRKLKRLAPYLEQAGCNVESKAGKVVIYQKGT